jgi:DNA-binding HxlR family transcriptional regulator
MKEHFGCPIQATSNVIAGKWKVLILWHLSDASSRFSELRGLLPGVSEKVLAAQLRELENDRLVIRTITQTVPPRVDYRLSPAGEELIPIMRMMCDWAGIHLGVLPNFPQRSIGAAGSKRLPLQLIPTESIERAAPAGDTSGVSEDSSK